MELTCDVSIIIPMYNAQKYIEQCIESCVRQDYNSFEIIIIDDGSTDESYQIAWDYAQKHENIILIKKPNGGTGSALNTGIQMSKGDWIKWVSADDVLLPDALQRMTGFANKKGKEFLYYTDYEIIDENGDFKRLFEEPDRSEMSQEIQAAEQYHNFFGNGSTSLIHKSMYNMIGAFNEMMPYNDDYEYWLRWCLKDGFGFCHIPIITVQYREHSESLTGKKKFSENKKLVDNLKRDYKKYLTKRQMEYLSKKHVPLRRRMAHYLPDPVLKKLVGLKNR